jgi:hypothetical protein
MHGPVNYEHNGGFFGRDELFQELIAQLLAETTIRSHIIQGPAGRGKTRLIYEVAQHLQRLPDQIVRVCFIESADLDQRAEAELVPFLTARLWLVVRDLLPTPPGPSQDLLEHGDQQAITQAIVADDLITLDQIRRLIEEVDQSFFLILVVDGLDEIAQLRLIEDAFIYPLIQMNSQVRILAARRASEARQYWSVPALRLSVREYPLEPFPETGVQNNPGHLHVADLLSLPDRPVLAIVPTVDLVAALIPCYSWSNPGANCMLIQAYFDHQGTLSLPDIEQCIRTLIHSHQEPPPAQAHWNVDYIFACVLQLTHNHGDLQKPQPASILTKAGGIEERHRAAFHRHLIACGICSQSNGMTFQIHRDLAELFLALI